MGDATKVITSIKKKDNVNYPCLTPNTQGLDAAIKAGVKEVAVFLAASDSFSKKNINCTVEESFERVRPLITKAKEHGILVRGYVLFSPLREYFLIFDVCCFAVCSVTLSHFGCHCTLFLAH